MKRKKIALVLPALFLASSLTACTQKASDPNQIIGPNIKSREALPLADNTFVPMDLRKKRMASMQCFDIDLAQAASEKLGIQIKQPIDWDMKRN